MATHSSTLAWKIPWTEKPGRLQSVGSQSQTRLSEMVKYLELVGYCWLFAISFTLLLYMEKEMATHSSILAWKIPWMEEPCRLQSMGSQRVGHD